MCYTCACTDGHSGTHCQDVAPAGASATTATLLLQLAAAAAGAIIVFLMLFLVVAIHRKRAKKKSDADEKLSSYPDDLNLTFAAATKIPRPKSHIPSGESCIPLTSNIHRAGTDVPCRNEDLTKSTATYTVSRIHRCEDGNIRDPPTQFQDNPILQTLLADGGVSPETLPPDIPAAPKTSRPTLHTKTSTDGVSGVHLQYM
ncbi:uncharacterized protein LOC125179183 [Hyalella azteca]|uniref:Uncharacterized protein LOC125179183 n=1 Tax=Hyalella azteca TaxID=294128 RepID=A0A979FVD3_HYAAZ|nr:uncharacterized protein LOC125179183 [Hyalella azteca]